MYPPTGERLRPCPAAQGPIGSQLRTIAQIAIPAHQEGKEHPASNNKQENNKQENTRKMRAAAGGRRPCLPMHGKSARAPLFWELPRRATFFRSGDKYRGGWVRTIFNFCKPRSRAGPSINAGRPWAEGAASVCLRRSSALEGNGCSGYRSPGLRRATQTTGGRCFRRGPPEFSAPSPLRRGQDHARAMRPGFLAPALSRPRPPVLRLGANL
jgi:hypothetical protein